MLIISLLPRKPNSAVTVRRDVFFFICSPVSIVTVVKFESSSCVVAPSILFWPQGMYCKAEFYKNVYKNT